MSKNSNNGAIIATVAAVGIASAVVVAGVIAKTLKNNLIRNLNDDEFENFNGYGKCTAYCCPNDSYDEVLKHRKGRHYRKIGAY